MAVNLTAIRPPRYGTNVAGMQVADRLTQEAFQNQENVNQQLDNCISALTVEISENKEQIRALAEAIQKLLDS